MNFTETYLIYRYRRPFGENIITIYKLHINTYKIANFYIIILKEKVNFLKYVLSLKFAAYSLIRKISLNKKYPKKIIIKLLIFKLLSTSIFPTFCIKKFSLMVYKIVPNGIVRDRRTSPCVKNECIQSREAHLLFPARENDRLRHYPSR